MPSITLKNLPGDLHRRLKDRAQQHQRSLTSEILACLRSAVGAERVDPDELLVRARANRARVAGRLTQKELRALKGEGRP
ncbi:MAG: FitA-like ribbon-helix-helix domain-containing protein [Myxococcaceae bacterium]